LTAQAQDLDQNDAMTDETHPFYKSQKGRQATVGWYDRLLDRFAFDHELRYVPTRFGQTHRLPHQRIAAQP
jgi:hypothetical protein